MRLMKGSLVGLVLAGILALAPTAAFAHGGGGGGHGGGGFGGGHGGGFGGGGGHFAGHSFAGHSFAEHQGAHFARQGDHFRHDGDFLFGGPFAYGDTYRMILRTTAIMTTMRAPIMLGNTHQPK